MLFTLRKRSAESAGSAGTRKDTWVIEPRRGGLRYRVQEIWRYRRILWFLSSRSVKDLYEGTVLGWLWLFIRPLAPIVISTFVFGRLLNVPSEQVPYFLFFLAGTTSWALFERSLIWATRSLSMHKGLITKVYFPRLIAPVASIAPAVVYFLVYASLLFCAVVYYRIHDGIWYVVLGPGLLIAGMAVLLSCGLAIAVGLWTSVWLVRARDVQYTVRYVTQFWSYLTPIIYPLSAVPPQYRWLVFLNPMAALVEAFKFGTLGIGSLHPTNLLVSLAVIGATAVGGIWYFDRSEAGSVDRM